MTPAPPVPFDPLVRAWFERRFGAPTEIQTLAWPAIAAGEHVLLTAPTGSGKTLTGFLWPLDRLLTGAWEGGVVRVLYVSPLKALNADIERNLRWPLSELTAALADAGREPPTVRVGVRSGDTPPAERARQIRRPPEILITTPESLNLLLLSTRAEFLFGGLRTVILDEIHAVAATKRGTHLVTAVERLARLAGEIQRIAISATVRPVERVARFVGGYRLERGAGGEPHYEPRPVRIVESRQPKRYDLRVRFPFPPGDQDPEARAGDAGWRLLAEDLRARIEEARSTVVFTNSRRTAEKMTRFVNESARRELAWSHHGSLSREIRGAVERRLKEGSLPAIVATSSLELGIDVGALDRAILLQAPRSLASAAQRVGRAGHGVGDVSRALIYPGFARDFLDCAVAARAVLAGEIEPVRPVRAPLDLLAQTVLALVARERWSLDELFAFARSSEPFHELSRRQFDLVIEMLAGRYAEARIEELRPRVIVDRIAGTIEGRPGTARLLARAGGTIPDRGYFQLRVEESRAKLGELDEEFVWERSVGDGFVLGTQAWRIRAITADEVLVAPARGGALLAPFWRADARDRGAYFSERVASFLEHADRRLEEEGFGAELERDFAFEPAAASEVVRLLADARAAFGVGLPHRRHLVFEEIEGRSGRGGSAGGERQIILYTFWGGSVNRPLAMALAGLWEERHGGRIEVVADDDALLFVLPEGADARALLAALAPERVEELLRRRLESSGFFGAHFRQNAQRALLLPRSGPLRRTPLWVSRQNAKRLLEAVSAHDDFPLVLETWRTCLADEFELEVLRERLRELAAGETRVSSVRTERPSPFAANLVWRRTNEQVYEDDAAESRRASGLRGDLLREIALAAAGRPSVSPAIVERFRRKAQRLLPGYAPRDAVELLEWLKERLWIPLAEWHELLAAVDRDAAADAAPDASPVSAGRLVEALQRRLVRLRPGTDAEAISAIDNYFQLRGSAALVRGLLDGAAPYPASAGTEIDLAPLLGDASAASPAKPSDAESAAGARKSSGDGEEDGEAAALARTLGQVLPFYGSLSVAGLGELAGVSAAELEGALEKLAREERAVVGELVSGAAERQVAARSSFETMLRWQRAEARAGVGFEPLPLERLPLAVATQQGLVERGAGIEGLQRALERLFGVAPAAGLWERAVLPARLEGYRPDWLDALFAESELVWFGAGRQRAAFAFRSDLALFAGEPGRAATSPQETDSSAALRAAVLEALSGAPSGLELADLTGRVGAGAAQVSAVLWDLTWAGTVGGDSVRALRRGIQSSFRPVETPAERLASGGEGRRASFQRWSASRPLAGRWFAIDAVADRGTPDPLAQEERHRERVRVLLDRWGVLFRELLAVELPALGWARLARTLRAMELSGEIVAGRYFDGVPGLQFAAPSTIARLRDGLPEAALWWHDAADPASLCGVDLPELKASLPRRVAGTQLVWRGARLAAVLRRSGREIEFRVAADDAGLAALVEPLRVALTRGFDPEHGLAVETINGEPAATSPYRRAFDAFSVVQEHDGLRLRRRYG